MPDKSYGLGSGDSLHWATTLAQGGSEWRSVFNDGLCWCLISISRVINSNDQRNYVEIMQTACVRPQALEHQPDVWHVKLYITGSST